MKPHGAIVLFGSQPFTSVMVNSNLRGYKHNWVWSKISAGNILVAKYQPLKTTEDIIVFSKDGKRVNYYPILEYNGKDRTKENPNVKKSDLFSGIKSGVFRKTDKNKPAGYLYPKHLIEISKQSSECANGKAIHPTQKPVELCEYLIKTYTKENELVLDNCMGSGSTIIACINTKRDYIGIELDDFYFRIAKERIELHTYE